MKANCITSESPKYNLTKAQARRFLLLKHGLVSKYRFPGKQGVLDYVRQAGCIQYDPIDICGKNSELVLQSRVENFTKDMLYELLYVDRNFLDYFDKNLSIIPVEDFPYFSRTKKRYRENTRSKQDVEKVSNEIISMIKKYGFACSKDIDTDKHVDWYWSATSLSRAALETLYFQGRLIIHHKKGTIKYYALAEDYVPAGILNMNDPNETDLDYYKWHVLRRIGSVGLLWNRASDAYLGIPGLNAANRSKAYDALINDKEIIAVNVEGIAHTLYCRADYEELLSEAMEDVKLNPRTEFIAPLDNLMWDRNLIDALFSFNYRWEIYNRPEDRKYGYYVLPILHGENLIGRIEAVNMRKEKSLYVKNIWLEPGIKETKALTAALNRCIKRFAIFNGCGDVINIC